MLVKVLNAGASSSGRGGGPDTDYLMDERYRQRGQYDYAPPPGGYREAGPRGPPPGGGGPGGGGGGADHHLHPLVALARWATVVYSLLVVFPLPAVAAPFPALARRIREGLEHWTERAPDTADLVLWVTVMGAVAASAAAPGDRRWFRRTLAATLTQTTTTTRGRGPGPGPGGRRPGDHVGHVILLPDWPTLRRRLTRLLWYADTNDPDGVRLWREVARDVDADADVDVDGDRYGDRDVDPDSDLDKDVGVNLDLEDLDADVDMEESPPTY